MRNTSQIFLTICLLSIGILVIASFKQPYWYYQCAHWAICGAALFGAYHAYKTHKTAFVWIFIVLAVVFNPVAPIYFHRAIWSFLDVVAAVIFLASIFICLKGPPTTP